MADFNRFAELAKKLHEAVKQEVKETAAMVKQAEQDYAAVASGFMRSAIYVKTQEASGYGQGLVGSGNLDPEIPPPPKDTMAYVVAGADYSIFVNHGSVHGPAQPFMEPGAEQIRPQWEARMSNLESKLK